MSNKCEFYNQTFLENLHNFEFDLDKKNVKYSDNKSVSLDVSKLENILSKIPITSHNIWTPYFIDQQNSNILHGNLARSTIIQSENLGVEEVIKFEPNLRDWTVSGLDMIVDWIITPILSPFTPTYGVLFWYKNKNKKSSYSINEIPVNSIVYVTKSFSYQQKIEDRSINVNITPKTKLIKKNNSILLIADQDKVILNNQNVLPNSSAKYFDISQYLAFKKESNPNNTESEKDFTFTFSSETKSSKLDDILIHISDGDSYSYIDSKDAESRDYISKIASKTYLSPVLHENYRQIYHHLTLDYKKRIEIVEDKDGNKTKVPQPMFPHKQFRLFKKLCYFLSTYPLIDRTTVSILQSKEVKEIVNKLIDTDVTSRQQEQQVLQKTLMDISKFFSDLYIPENFYDKNNLPQKLLTKYGAKLRSSEDKISLSFKNELEYGENIKCNWDINALCKKDVKSSDINYNLTIRTGRLTAQSNITNNSANMLLRTVGVGRPTTIPLWDIQKRKLINNNALFSVGQDVEIDFNNLNSIPERLNVVSNRSLSDKENVLNYELSFNLNLGLFLEDTILEGSTISAEWSKIEGPDCLRFGNSDLTSIRDNGIFVGSAGDARFVTSSDISPNIYIKSPGKYTIQCRLSSNFGVFVDTINIHVINRNNNDFEIYTRPVTDTLRRARTINLAGNNKNIITLPNIREFIIGKSVFWPTYSDLSILVPRRFGRVTVDFIEPLGSPKTKFSFPIIEEESLRENPPKTFFSLSIETKNCIVDISQMILSNIYGEKTPYCEPIYRCTIDNELFDLDQSSLSIKDPSTNQYVDIPSPTIISTNNLEIRQNNLQKTNQLKAVMFDQEENLRFNKYKYNEDIYGSRPGSRIEGRGNAPSENVIAYENFPNPTDSNYQNFMDSLVVPMKKTYFHPNSGLLETNYVKNNITYNNKTSIIIGDHSKRNCKTFRGLGFETLKNESTNIQIYSSDIILMMDKPTHDLGGDADQESKIAHDKAFSTPEFFSKNYGYRNVSQNVKSSYAYTDEIKFVVFGEPDGPVQSTDYCNKRGIRSLNRAIEYSYQYPGPRYSPEFIEPFLYDRNFGRTIGDLEIKLNYLNYINPKELVIWLDIEPPGKVGCSVNPRVAGGRANDPYYFNSLRRDNSARLINNIPNKDIKKYLTNLFEINNNLFRPMPLVGSSADKILLSREISSFDMNYSTFLLNQDHLDFSTYNNILKFSDNTNNVPNNKNVNQLLSSVSDNIVSRNKNGEIELAPTKSAPNFSDNESYKYKTIIENNKLSQYLGTNFFKLQNMPLFDVCPPGEEEADRPANSDTIRFRLNIAIVQESDEGFVYDRIINTDNILNINNIKTKNISNITTNSLCSWDLIISNSKEQLNFEDKDALGQIDYNNSFPKYDGYNFYGKIPRELVPQVNLNAPNNAFFNFNSCFYSRESLTLPRIPQAPVLNITPLVYIPSFTLVGEVNNAANLIDQGNNQSREIVGFLNDLRRQAQQAEFNSEIYIPKFENYLAGRSEKALISISKDKKIWYKLEAGILRYKNCPVLKNKIHKYKKIHYLNELRELAKFNISTINNIEDLIDITNLKTININKDITFNDIQKKSFFDKVKKEILNLERQIASGGIDLGGRSISDRDLEILQERLSNYKNFYYSVGPAGFEDDDIVRIEFLEEKREEEEIKIKYYTLKIEEEEDNDKIIFIEVGTKNLKKLLANNKSIFINNNILEIYENLPEEEQEEQEEQQSDEEKKSNNLVIINELRPYFIYEKDSSLTFFEKRENLTNSEKSKIASIQKSIDQLNAELQKLLEELATLEEQFRNSNFNDWTSKQINPAFINKIKTKKKEIIDKEAEIFLIEHSKIENKLLSKAMILKEQKPQTLLYLENPIKENFFLVITPDDNRIIVYDKDYYTQISQEKDVNQWTFYDNNINRNSVIQSSESTINPGSYGSGSKFNKQEYLYNTETPNRIKNFIENIENNIMNGLNHVERCKLFQIKENSNDFICKFPCGGRLKNIFIENLIKLKEPYPYEIAKLDNDRDKYKILDSIMNINKYNSYLKNMGINYFLEANIDLETEEDGYLELTNNSISDYIYKLVDKNKNPIDLSLLMNRIKVISIGIKKEQDSIELNDKKLSITTNPNEIKNINQAKSISISKINILRLEYNHLSYYIDKCSADGANIIPNIFAIVNINEDKSISVMEETTEDYYIINIDQHQFCYFDQDKNPKVMQRVRYQLVGESNRFLYGADPFMFIGPFIPENFTSEDFDYSSDSVGSTFTFKENYVNKMKNFFNIGSNFRWQLMSSERTFYLNGGSFRGAIVKAIYTYHQVSLANDPSTNVEEEPELSSVKNIFNLDNTEDLYIDFKRIPRNLRNVDNIFDRYIPNSDGFLTKSLIPSPGGPVDASLKTWKCVSSKSGSKVSLPDNFKWMNLMKYIAFYKNYLIEEYDLDINQNMQIVRCRDEMELIPYDYFDPNG